MLTRFTAFCGLFMAASFLLNAQNTPTRPKLVIGIVVDQMRYDYLYRYEAEYGNGGFKRLLRDGFSCENTHFNYVPTYTGPGHAAVYTGTTPSVNGIVGNDWFDRELNKNRYVTADPAYQSVGAPNGRTGQHSPTVLLSTTITDELRLSNNYRSKVVGVCLKDRGSILPAGHIPNAAYWFDDATGNFITSSYYPDSLGLPKWVQDFNSRKLAEKYASGKWDKLPGVDYSQSFADWKQHEDAGYFKYFTGDMPYDLAAIRQKTGNVGVIRFTPFGNTITLDFALEAIDKMELGADNWTDFLCLSFSSTDYVGHQFGVHAEETQDTYLKLDKDLERLLNYLDQKFGKDQVLVFLTADHGGCETPEHFRELRIPTGIFPESKLEEKLEQALATALGSGGDYIQAVSNQQIWLNWQTIADYQTDPYNVEAAIKAAMRDMPGVYDVLTRDDLDQIASDYPFASRLRNGIHPRRSGDIIFQLDPAWHADDAFFGDGGCTHGSSYPYDTHVPLLWYGWKSPKGTTHRLVQITDIAPTLASMLRIMEPNGTTGEVITELFGN